MGSWHGSLMDSISNWKFMKGLCRKCVQTLFKLTSPTWKTEGIQWSNKNPWLLTQFTSKRFTIEDTKTCI